MAKKKSRHIAIAPPKVDVCVICDSVSRDPNSGKATLYGLFDVISSKKFPFHYASFALYVTLSGKGKHRLSIHLADPKGHTQKLGESEIQVPPDGKASIQVEFVGMTFKQPGMYELRLRVGRKTLARVSLPVKRQPPDKRKK